LTADWHLRISPDTEYRWNVFDFVRSAARRTGAGVIVVLGDIGDQKDRHDATMTNRTASEFRKLAEEFTVIVVKGNHDYINEREPFFGFLEGTSSSLRFISKPTALNLGGLRTVILPHQHGGLAHKMPNLCPNGKAYDLVLVHQTFTGVVACNGESLKGTSAGVLSKKRVGSARVYSGDIHNPQRVGNVQYVGAPYHVAFGDNYEGRVLFIDHGVETPIYNRAAPKKHTLRLTGSDMTTGAWRDALADVYELDFVTAKLFVARTEVASVPAWRGEIADAIKALGALPRGVQVSTHEGLRQVRRSGRPSGGASPVAMFDAYCKARGISEELADEGRKYL
jgi:predicted phosphodiesterase